jgi:integrase
MSKVARGKPLIRARGTIEKMCCGLWRARITLPDGTRRRSKGLPAGTTEEQARAIAQQLAEAAERVGLKSVSIKELERIAAGSSETVAAWSKRWLEERKKRGIASISSDKGRLNKHVLPLLTGSLRSVTRADVERVVDSLDLQVRAKTMSWETSRHVWHLLTGMFRDARGSKNKSLRVREDDPCLGVLPPDRGIRKAKVFLFPSEFLALISCARLPLHWRQLYAVAVYTYARAGEIAALDWTDVDFDHAAIHFHASLVWRTGVKKSTKSGITRRIAIEAALMPLLERMRAVGGGEGAVLPKIGGEEKLSRTLRRHLKMAGVKRADLFANDEARKHITFHDLRATGITWMAIRGDDPLKIRSRAGHRSFATTEIYIREAEPLKDAFGEVFPELPESLVGMGAKEVAA